MKKESFISHSKTFNLVYKRKNDGEIVKAKRQVRPPKYMLENGEIFSASSFRKHFSFIEELVKRKTFESKSNFFSLLYEDENGDFVKAKRQDHPARYMVESGETFSGTMFQKLFTFVAFLNEKGQRINYWNSSKIIEEN